MRLNHINLAVPDVPLTRTFLERHFGLRFIGALAPNKLAALMDDAANIVTISNLEKDTVYSYPRTFHIGFSQPSREEVDRVRTRLCQAGYEVESPRMIHGAWSFYFSAPGGFTIEVMYQEPIPGVEPLGSDKNTGSWQ